MAEGEHNGSNGRVTNAQLKLELDNVRQEQKTEHIKTRAIVAVIAAAGNAKALSFLLGAIWGVHLPW